jgi:hypothetical protein
MRRTLHLVPCVFFLFTFGSHTARLQAPADLFDFQSNFWVNLHNYLHALARGDAPLVEPLPAGATAGEREQWNAAVQQYRERFGKRSLLFDDELVKANRALSDVSGDGSVASANIAAEHRGLLESAAPVYRRHRWNEHDAANRRFISALAPLLKEHGPAIARRLVGTFDTAWPSRPIRVDVVHDAGPPGNARTNSEPTHITIAADDPRHQGLAALEVIFHEASHKWDAILMKDVDEAAARLNVRRPPGLWHGLLFFNAGRITADTLAAAGVPDYVAYMDTQRMFDRAYRGMRPAITKHWSAFLAGQVSRSEAIERILRELPAAPPK